MKTPVETIVVDENTLAYYVQKEKGYCGVLRSSILRGGSGTNEPFWIGCLQTVRPATKKDFEDFRVAWHPHYLVKS